MMGISEKNLLYIKGGVMPAPDLVAAEKSKKTKQFDLLSENFLRVRHEQDKRKLEGGV